MHTLKERIKVHAIEYKKIIHCEKIAQQYIERLKPLLPEKIEMSCSCGVNHFSINLFKVDNDDFELNLISVISEICNCKWNKHINEEGAIYQTSFTTPDDICYCGFISVYTILPSTCQIITVPIGRKKVPRWVEVEEELFEHKILCSEE